MFNLIEQIIAWALGLIDKFGYAGIFLTMAFESAAIPIPSEVVVPFGGFLASGGRLSFWPVVLVATLANLAGSIVIYLVGLSGGRWFLERYGKYVLVHQDDISKMDRWLDKYGSRVAFFSRLMPGVRTFSSLVIGAGKMNFKRFLFYTFLGSFLWNLPLAYIGLVTGKNWNVLQPYFHKFELLIAALIVIAITLFVFKHIHKIKRLRNHPQL